MRASERESVRQRDESSLLCRLDVHGRPATFATVAEGPWKEAVREAVLSCGINAHATGPFAVRMEFRTPPPRTANDRWDLDNLVKPTLDALDGVFGLRAWAGRPQPNDDRVTYLEAWKRDVRTGETRARPSRSGSTWIGHSPELQLAAANASSRS